VQILDVATGTGTFLNEVVQLIHEGFAGQEGQWPSYAIEDLLPRLHGFELMMASYTIAHLKLGMALHESGVPLKDKRLGIYLTNTLEDAAAYQELCWAGSAGEHSCGAEA
jgi:predicted helicase